MVVVVLNIFLERELRKTYGPKFKEEVNIARRIKVSTTPIISQDLLKRGRYRRRN